MLVYLSGPITPKDDYTLEQNVHQATEVFFILIKLGVHCLCPHFIAADRRAAHIDYSRWMDYDFAMIDACTHVLMLPRWTTSGGACLEKEYADQQRKPVAYSIQEILLCVPKKPSSS